VTTFESEASETGDSLFLYTLLLGLRGTRDDAETIRKRIDVTGAPGSGLNSLFAGYLMLARTDGLKLVDEKLKDQEISFSEAYSILNSLRFMRRNCPDRIPTDRLNQSMRLLLNDKGLQDYVIPALADGKDWSVQDRLMKLYPDGIPATKRAIIRYIMACSKDVPKNAPDKVPEHATTACKYLEELRKNDPKRVEEVERFSAANFFGRDK
jgi:hypothetical protein